MRARLRPALLLLVLLPLGPALAKQRPVSPAAPRPPRPQTEARRGDDPLSQLQDRLEKLMRRCRRCTWGVLVKEGASGRVLVERNSQLAFNPASNVKLVSAAAALHQLGPQYRFSTRVLGRLVDGKLVGGVYLQGGGDPTLTDAGLAEMAESLRQLGVDAVDGPLYLDTSAFKDSIDPPGYARFRSSHPFRAGVDALSLNRNVLRITVAPGEQPGARGLASVGADSDYLKIQANVVTTTRPTRLHVATFSAGPRTGVSITGRIRDGDDALMFWRRVFHPALYAGHAFLRQLQAQGIRVAGPVRLKPAPAGTPLLAEKRSEQLTAIIYEGLKRSDNVLAEQLLLAAGADAFGPPAQFEKGRRAIDLYLRGLGMRAGSYWFENGSGLSRRSRIRPADLVRVLESMSSDLGIGPEILAALPVAGRDGTLAKRFAGSPATGYLRAKTGTLSGISCLSGDAGYGERRLLFSFMAGRVARLPVARRLQAAMAESLVEYLRQLSRAGEVPVSKR